MASLYTNEELPTTSEQAIRVFDERYLAGISAEQPPMWAALFGDSVSLGAPRATFPIGMMSTKYTETKEVSGRFKTMAESAFDLRVVEYDNGYEAKLMDLYTQVYAYKKWTEIPSRWVIAEQRHINRNIATLLEAGTDLSPWDSVAFFSATHKANPTGDPSTTFSNYQATPADVTDMSKLLAEVTAMRGVLDENGEKFDVDPDTILVPTAKYEPLKFVLAQNLILQGAATAPTSNPYFGNKFNVIHVPEFTDVNDWYLVDSKLMARLGVPPWLAAKYLAPNDLGLRKFDESSDFFKNSGKIKVASHIWYGFKLVFPHAIRKVVGA